MANPSWSNSPPVEPCGGNFPSVFICPRTATCIQLTTNYSATMCCPEGQSCDTITTISCDTTLWNTTTSITNQFHAIGAVNLPKCGQSCCPIGYNCNGTMCTRTLEKIAATSSVETQQTTTHRPTAVHTLSITSTARVKPITSLAPTQTIVPSSHPQSAADGLNTTAKTLISVLAALLLIIIVAVTWRYIYRRRHNQAQLRNKDGSIASHYACHYGKAELAGIGMRTATPVAEMNGYRTPGELSARGSVYNGRYAPSSLKELQAAYFQRPRSINSERREMDAWSLHGWKTLKQDWD